MMGLEGIKRYELGKADFLLPYKCATQECVMNILLTGSKKNTFLKEDYEEKKFLSYFLTIPIIALIPVLNA